jgi:Predicted membrane protein
MRNYIIYGLTGWCLEVVWTGLGSLMAGDPRLTAKTYLWMFPIYGLAVFFEPVHDLIRPWPLLVRGLFWTAVFFAVEYLTGWTLRGVVGTSPWDYSAAPWQIDGLIRLDYAPAWFILGLLFEKLHDGLEGAKTRQ